MMMPRVVAWVAVQVVEGTVAVGVRVVMAAVVVWVAVGWVVGHAGVVVVRLMGVET